MLALLNTAVSYHSRSMSRSVYTLCSCMGNIDDWRSNKRKSMRKLPIPGVHVVTTSNFSSSTLLLVALLRYTVLRPASMPRAAASRCSRSYSLEVARLLRHVFTMCICASLNPSPPRTTGARHTASTRLGSGARHSRVRKPPSGSQPRGGSPPCGGSGSRRKKLRPPPRPLAVPPAGPRRRSTRDAGSRTVSSEAAAIVPWDVALGASARGASRSVLAATGVTSRCGSSSRRARRPW